MMNKELKEWTLAFVKHKDLAFGKLVEIKESKKENKIDFKFKDKTNTHIITEKLDESVLKSIEKIEHKTIVCLNNEDNFNFLTKNWKKIVQIKNLTFIFVNLKNQEKWLINPHIHNMIAEEESLVAGLKAMFDTCNGKIIDVSKGKKPKKTSMFEEGSPLDSEDEGEEENE